MTVVVSYFREEKKGWFEINKYSDTGFLIESIHFRDIRLAAFLANCLAALKGTKPVFDTYIEVNSCGNKGIIIDHYKTGSVVSLQLERYEVSEVVRQVTALLSTLEKSEIFVNWLSENIATGIGNDFLYKTDCIGNA